MKPVMYVRGKRVCQIKPSQSRSLPVKKIHYFLIIVKDANLCSCLLRFVTWLLDFDRVQNCLLTQGNKLLTQSNNWLT